MRTGTWNPAGLLGGGGARAELVGLGDSRAPLTLPFLVHFVRCLP